jgi:hypothetical protein
LLCAPAAFAVGPARMCPPRQRQICFLTTLIVPRGTHMVSNNQPPPPVQADKPVCQDLKLDCQV